MLQQIGIPDRTQTRPLRGRSPTPRHKQRSVQIKVETKQPNWQKSFEENWPRHTSSSSDCNPVRNNTTIYASLSANNSDSVEFGESPQRYPHPGFLPPRGRPWDRLIDIVNNGATADRPTKELASPLHRRPGRMIRAEGPGRADRVPSSDGRAARSGTEIAVYDHYQLIGVRVTSERFCLSRFLSGKMTGGRIFVVMLFNPWRNRVCVPCFDLKVLYAWIVTKSHTRFSIHKYTCLPAKRKEMMNNWNILAGS